jgi:hypothetical protein
MPRRTLTLAAVAALLLLVGTQAFGQPGSAKQGCTGSPNPSLHWNAVFAHATSLWQVTLMRRRIQSAGFGGVQFKKDHCDDIEVIVPGADTPAIRNELVREADLTRVGISFEPPDILKRPDRDVFKAVFGVRPTLSRANRLQLDIAHVGFREGTDIERLALHSWRVVLYNVPVKDAQNFAAEAASVGYRVTFLSQ